MKTDAQLQTDIIDELRWEPRIREQEIGVAVKDGTKDQVVTLSGSVSSFAERRAAESAAWSAPGVKEVKDNLVVRV